MVQGKKSSFLPPLRPVSPNKCYVCRRAYNLLKRRRENIIIPFLNNRRFKIFDSVFTCDIKSLLSLLLLLISFPTCNSTYQKTFFGERTCNF